MKVLPTEKKPSDFFGLLTSAIAPRPIAMVSTISKEGQVNLSPFSFFNVFSSNPAMVVFSPARSGRDNSLKHTYLNVKEYPECTVNVVNYEMVQQTSLSSSMYAKGVNEFDKAGFTQLDSEFVKPPRIKESPVQLECKVKDVIELGQEGGAGNLVLAEIIAIHVNDTVLDKNGQIDANKIRLVGRMGSNLYNKAFDEALFEVNKPGVSLGIGVDQLPEEVRNSKILSGNELGKLAGVSSLPNETDVNEYKLLELADVFMEFEGSPKALELKLHGLAKDLINKDRVEEALMCLLTFNN